MSASAARPPAPAYLAHWGLAEAPFRLEPDPRFAYERSDHREGLARVLFGITQLGGLVVITGEIGSGKTLLAQTLVEVLHGEGYHVATVANPPRTAAALLAAALPAMGGEPAGGSAARLAGRVRERLAEAEREGRRVVLVIDEAQRLDPRALDEVRMLTNPGDRGAGAPVVLLGQPELTVRVERLPQVSQRVVVRYHLGPMSAEEVDAYARHRARVAGAERRILSERGARAVHEETGGIPRLVNMLLANALFVAAGRGGTQIGEDDIRDLAEDRRMSLEAAEASAEASGMGDRA
ncbi:ExeA family protein [Miltoncostaea marina]|uniref:ExeA family protein n=1 Tax=Miltoncostaea marina TaxID=2843215 RepID=UPI001C3DD73B|nr:AAA family ATPase [Miltoncostaea marina]